MTRDLIENILSEIGLEPLDEERIEKKPIKETQEDKHYTPTND